MIATGEIITVAWGGMGLRITGAEAAINATDRDLVNGMVKGMPMLIIQEEVAITMERQLRKRRGVLKYQQAITRAKLEKKNATTQYYECISHMHLPSLL